MDRNRKETTTNDHDETGLKEKNKNSRQWRKDQCWDRWFEKLMDFQTRNGHCDVPRIENTSLSLWAGKQRNIKSELSNDQIKRLDSIGFDWETRELKNERLWVDKYNVLLKFHERYGHARVPTCDKKLFRWCRTQREANDANKISPERKRKLDRLGFSWSNYGKEALAAATNEGMSRMVSGCADGAWKDYFDKLVKYKSIHRHCNVPHNYEDKNLCAWVSTQRSLHKEGSLSTGRMKMLENLGFVWEIDFGRLTCSKESHQSKFAKGSENKGGTSQVGRIGFSETMGENDEASGGRVSGRKWDIMFTELIEYERRHGHTMVPSAPWGLGHWVDRQRKLYKDNKLRSTRVEKLKSIGFVWDERFVAESSWLAGYEKLMQFKSTHGHCYVMPKHQDQELSDWVATQRMLYRNGSLPRDRQEFLDDVGFEWYDKPEEIEKADYSSRGSNNDATMQGCGDDDDDSTTDLYLFYEDYDAEELSVGEPPFLFETGLDQGNDSSNCVDFATDAMRKEHEIKSITTSSSCDTSDDEELGVVSVMTDSSTKTGKEGNDPERFLFYEDGDHDNKEASTLDGYAPESGSTPSRQQWQRQDQMESKRSRHTTKKRKLRIRIKVSGQRPQGSASSHDAEAVTDSSCGEMAEEEDVNDFVRTKRSCGSMDGFLEGDANREKRIRSTVPKRFGHKYSHDDSSEEEEWNGSLW